MVPQDYRFPVVLGISFFGLRSAHISWEEWKAERAREKEDAEHATATAVISASESKTTDHWDPVAQAPVPSEEDINSAEPLQPVELEATEKPPRLM